jgi:hypothetical protein
MQTVEAAALMDQINAFIQHQTIPDPRLQERIRELETVIFFAFCINNFLQKKFYFYQKKPKN